MDDSLHPLSCPSFLIFYNCLDKWFSPKHLSLCSAWTISTRFISLFRSGLSSEHYQLSALVPMNQRVQIAHFVNQYQQPKNKKGKKTSQVDN